MYLGPAGGVKMPNLFMPKLMNNHGNFVGSLGNLARYLGRQAEALGVEIYPGFPAAEVLVEDNKVVGVATGDMGIGRRRAQCRLHPRHGAARPVHDVRGRRARLAHQGIVERFGLNAGKDHQKYGLGVKELWQVRPEKFQPGLVRHSMGWPLPNNAGGGSWLYHFDDHLVSVGFVVHLNYKNPTLSPFDELQRFKTIRWCATCSRAETHRLRRAGDHGGRLAVGAAPDLPGRLPGRGLGRLRERAAHQGHPQRDPVGDAVRRARVRGAAGRAGPRRGVGLRGGLARLADRLRPEAGAQRQAVWSRYGTAAGVALGGLDMWMTELFGWSPFGTMRHGKPDHACTLPLDR